jgi:hypothetical protein
MRHNETAQTTAKAGGEWIDDPTRSLYLNDRTGYESFTNFHRIGNGNELF